MLEKLGLPAKPSLRGNNWVVDASHCQGCSSQFTFINRKHHCQRCGGLFCARCTQQRMALRGQGDSPVRICDPCKQQEEAARYELRHGSRNRAGKATATSKGASRSTDEVLQELLGGHGKGSSSHEEVSMQGGESVRSVDSDDLSVVLDESSSYSPEELRQQALEERNKHKTLKGQGKNSEALKAFKRAKELERQAAAVDLQLRKNRKRALASPSIISIGSSQNDEDSPPEVIEKGKNPARKGKEKDDLNAELKALGWSEPDLHEAERKPASTSVESELFSLMGEASEKNGSKKATGGVDKTAVIALKKKAVVLKREGKLAEAKEELKKAKILEKQLEEQEFLADADESDDEISALIRSMDDEKDDDLSMEYQLDSGFDFSDLAADAGDLGIGSTLEVTDDDMYDPDLAATLRSMGWEEEPDQPVEIISQTIPVDRERLQQEVISLKKEAVREKQSGNVAEALSLLKKAKLLEKELQGFESHNLGPAEKEPELDVLQERTNPKPKQAPKSRLVIQRELLALKKKALALKREGKVDEAEEELEKGKILEEQLANMDNAPKAKATSSEPSVEPSQLSNQQLDISTALPNFDVGESDITDQDLHDPAYLTLLKNMGWQDEDHESTMPPPKPLERNDAPVLRSGHEVGNKRTKGEIQRELLGLKRKAMALRRQGQSSEAEEVLETAKVLESKLAEMEGAVKEEPTGLTDHLTEVKMTKDEVILVEDKNAKPASESPPEVRHAPEKSTESEYSADAEATSSQNASIDPPQLSPQQVIISHKRKALALKKEGKLAEAREELRKAKLLEKSLEEGKSQDVPNPTSAVEVATPSASFIVHEELSPPPKAAPKPMSSSERFKLQRECLNHKRSALKLRKEGRAEEAEAELEIAKTLEARLEEASGHIPGESSKEDDAAADIGLEGLLDPQILSALKAIGLQDDHTSAPAPSRTQPVQLPVSVSVSAPLKGGSSNQERVQLEAEIKAEKVKALNLKRAGKQAEALDALRKAKQMEKKLTTLPS